VFLLNAQPTTRRNYGFTASLDMNRDFLNPNSQPPVAFPLNITGHIIYDDAKPLPPFVVNEWKPVNDYTFDPLDNQALLGTPTKEINLDFNFGVDGLGIAR
jgi:iron transport multicopper oxidase